MLEQSARHHFSCPAHTCPPGHSSQASFLSCFTPTAPGGDRGVAGEGHCKAAGLADAAGEGHMGTSESPGDRCWGGAQVDSREWNPRQAHHVRGAQGSAVWTAVGRRGAGRQDPRGQLLPGALVPVALQRRLAFEIGPSALRCPGRGLGGNGSFQPQGCQGGSSWEQPTWWRRRCPTTHHRGPKVDLTGLGERMWWATCPGKNRLIFTMARAKRRNIWLASGSTEQSMKIDRTDRPLCSLHQLLHLALPNASTCRLAVSPPTGPRQD